MNTCLLRRPVPSDLPALTLLWQEAFADSASLISNIITAGDLLQHGILAEVNGQPVSAMYAFPRISLEGHSAAYLYALSTKSDFRGKGLGSAVLHGLMAQCFDEGSEIVFLSPADESISRWYQARFGLQPLLPYEIKRCKVEPHLSGKWQKLLPEVYAEWRKSLCAVPLPLLRAQNELFQDEGGGFYRLSLPKWDCLCCLTPKGDHIKVAELICPDESRALVLQSIAAQFGAEELLLPESGAAHPLLGCTASGLLPKLSASCFFPFLMD